MEASAGPYTMKSVVRLTGLSPDTLRAWERRYGAVRPQRSGNGRRAYSPEDVWRLKLLGEAVRRGHAIGSIADKDTEDLQRLLEESGTMRSRAGGLTPAVERVMKAVENFDTSACELVMGTALSTLPVESVIDELILPSLRTVGDRWAAGDLTVAHERFLSSAVKRLAMNMLTTLSRNTGQARIVLGTPSGELHELGALLSAINAAALGVGCAYVGAQLPGAEFARYAAAVGAEVVALSVVQKPIAEDSFREVRALVEDAPDQLHIWIGGASAPELAERVGGSRLTLVSGLDEFRARLSTLKA